VFVCYPLGLSGAVDIEKVLADVWGAAVVASVVMAASEK
jgi:hypothetical protein